VDLAGFVADWLVVPEGVLLPVEGLALEELLGNGSELFIAKTAEAVGVDLGKVHILVSRPILGPAVCLPGLHATLKEVIPCVWEVPRGPCCPYLDPRVLSLLIHRPRMP
jgi:hypothetical protein